jgi:hypothetical protein
VGHERQDRLTDESFITLKDASEILDLPEAEVENLINHHKLTAYQLGDQVIRLRRDQIWEFQSKARISAELFPDDRRKHLNATAVVRPNVIERALDFLYFNDFYIICFAAIGILLYLILTSQ